MGHIHKSSHKDQIHFVLERYISVASVVVTLSDVSNMLKLPKNVHHNYTLKSAVTHYVLCLLKCNLNILLCSVVIDEIVLRDIMTYGLRDMTGYNSLL